MLRHMGLVLFYLTSLQMELNTQWRMPQDHFHWPAELNYAQLDKEGLAIIFGVKRFHQYLLGRKFTIYSDHKPLEHLFSRSRAIPPLASARIQRWALTLGAYDYNISYKPGKDQTNADLLSRLPLPEAPREVPVPADTILLMDYLQASPIQ